MFLNLGQHTQAQVSLDVQFSDFRMLASMNSLEKAKYTDQYTCSFCLKAIGCSVFKICLFLISLYYIVFANKLLTLMRKIGKKWT